MVNTILEYCAGRITLDHVIDLLERRVDVDKTKAPAEGLALLEVKYNENVFEYNKQMENIIINEYLNYRSKNKIN